MRKQDILTALILVFIGAAIAMVMAVIIEAHKPPTRHVCNDGWTREEVDGKIVETYLPDNDTCKKGR